MLWEALTKESVGTRSEPSSGILIKNAQRISPEIRCDISSENAYDISTPLHLRQCEEVRSVDVVLSCNDFYRTQTAS